MDTTETFLDNMFAPYPASPRLTEARGELRAMMEDAYNDAIAQGKTHNEAVGQVITDFGNLQELAPVLGIAQDIQPGGAPQAAPAGGAPTAPTEPSRPTAPAPAPTPAGDYAAWQRNEQDEDEDDPFITFVASIYWPAMVAIYLLWSFIFKAWDISWIIWPVAAIAFWIFVSARSARTAWRRMR
ncbi:permease prefix domain 1-containing protein [Actinomyces sp. ZJ308]|uniref:permease prefix domain 1-containing protein n=1 Tax=Actinomyces sp. ZJ308 TaxID=2708342 RepID=UPI0014238268|nr:permease prefix domain 1-containing protein [Actinomyces sp. ZJ308]